MRQALRNSNLLKAEQFALQAAMAGQDAAKSRYLPRGTLEESFAASNSPTRTFMMKLDQGRFTSSDFLINNLNNPGVETDFRTAVTLEQTLYDRSVPFGADNNKEIKMKSVLLMIGFLVLWFVLQKYILPRLGVPT